MAPLNFHPRRSDLVVPLGVNIEKLNVTGIGSMNQGRIRLSWWNLWSHFYVDLNVLRITYPNPLSTGGTGLVIVMDIWRLWYIESNGCSVYAF